MGLGRHLRMGICLRPVLKHSMWIFWFLQRSPRIWGSLSFKVWKLWIKIIFSFSPFLILFFHQGGSWKNWKRRWFVLNDRCLYYFQHTAENVPKGIIPLENVRVRALDEKDGKRYCFIINFFLQIKRYFFVWN